MTILIVEDNQISASILKATLRKSGYQTEWAVNGRDGLEKLKSIPDVQVIISDLMMPEMDGIELLRTVSSTPEYATIPFIMCTALADAEHVKMAGALGCKHYLVKPIQPPELLRRVEEVLRCGSVVMKEIKELQEQFGLDVDEFLVIAADFRDLLLAQVDLLKSMGDQAEADESRLALCTVSESATAFGAERLVSALAGATGRTMFGKSGAAELNLGLILTEMESVIQALSPGEEDVSPKDATPSGG